MQKKRPFYIICFWLFGSLGFLSVFTVCHARSLSPSEGDQETMTEYAPSDLLNVPRVYFCLGDSPSCSSGHSSWDVGSLKMLPDNGIISEGVVPNSSCSNVYRRNGPTVVQPSSPEGLDKVAAFVRFSLYLGIASTVVLGAVGVFFVEVMMYKIRPKPYGSCCLNKNKERVVSISVTPETALLHKYIRSNIKNSCENCLYLSPKF